MENIHGVHLEEVIFASADKKISAQISKLQKHLEDCNAFPEHTEGQLKIVKRA